MKALTVTEPFAGYAKGDQITDADKIDAALASNPMQVVAVNLPDPSPAKSSSSDAPQS
ncbi:hypothetical protein [Rhizobium rhizogenes]|uniref:hypothetical protein n=1 Tax=Rhizobium rhizogenes TaxID=359 RepID=UPI0015733ED7|nr:hypothetical protein [Rhizobium rhizogenes]NTF67971.1 hypothetical protein [Rhizobium rhizogenes]NTG73299.1 hypothetical protein [Rhizobium rhizogenes]